MPLSHGRFTDDVRPAYADAGRTSSTLWVRYGYADERYGYADERYGYADER